MPGSFLSLKSIGMSKIVLWESKILSNLVPNWKELEWIVNRIILVTKLNKKEVIFSSLNLSFKYWYEISNVGPIFLDLIRRDKNLHMKNYVFDDEKFYIDSDLNKRLVLLAKDYLSFWKTYGNSICFDKLLFMISFIGVISLLFCEQNFKEVFIILLSVTS